MSMGSFRAFAVVLITFLLNTFAAGAAETATSDDAGAPTIPPTRVDTIGGYHFGLALGFIAFEPAAERRGGIGGGAALHFTGGIALWDRIPMHVGFGALVPRDRAPIYQEGVFCEVDENGLEICGEPEVGKSSVSGGYLSFETGYQHRLRLSSSVALVPAGLLGYLWNVSAFSRAVGCKECQSFPVDVNASGGYVAPLLRVAFGTHGAVALSVRTNWFMAGDLRHMTLFGLEFGAP
jgi:hypothetical protein